MWDLCPFSLPRILELSLKRSLKRKIQIARGMYRHTNQYPSQLRFILLIRSFFLLDPDTMDPTYPLVPIANIIGCALTLIPLFHMHARSWNTGVYVFVLWLFLSCFQTAINTMVWANDVEDRAPVWCDICKYHPIHCLSIMDD